MEDCAALYSRIAWVCENCKTVFDQLKAGATAFATAVKNIPHVSGFSINPKER